jgi:hypothetical protein
MNLDLIDLEEKNFFFFKIISKIYIPVIDDGITSVGYPWEALMTDDELRLYGEA